LIDLSIHRSIDPFEVGGCAADSDPYSEVQSDQGFDLQWIDRSMAE
jgi:hypothetical protein